jgi:NAD(P)H-flavin reductase
VKKVAADPAAQWQWLWQTPATKIIGSELQVRVGGSFVWPPPGVMVSTLRKVVFVAGGVGVNPLVSMLGHLCEGRAGLGPNAEVHFFYSMKDPGEGKRDAARMLFLDRIDRVFAQGKVRGRLHLFLTTENGEADTREVHCARGKITFEAMRIKTEDVASVIGHDKHFSAVYVCGVPTMTDDFVEKLTSRSELGLEPHRVLFEKWW